MGGTIVTIEVEINFLSPDGANEILIADAKRLDIKRKLSLWQVEEIRRDSGELGGIAQGWGYF